MDEDIMLDTMNGDDESGEIMLDQENPIEIVIEKVEPIEKQVDVPIQPIALEQAPSAEEPLLIKHKLPGAGDADFIELDEEPEEKVPEEEKPQKQPKNDWDWQFHGLPNFLNWVNDRYQKIPRHSGKEISGLERACSYLEKLYDEIRKAMRMDYDGALDHDKIEKINTEIENGVNNLKEQIQKIEKSKKKAQDEQSMVKTAGIAKTLGIVATVPLILLRCAMVIINGTVTAGHDSKDLFNKLSKKFKLTDREQIELQELLIQMDFGLDIIDRAYDLDEDVDITDNDGELQSNYPGA